jgi:agmatinase
MKYQPKNCLDSPRFCGIRTFMLLPHLRTLEDVDFIVAGIPYDTSCSTRVGARFGPAAIRDASMLLRPYNPDMDINIFEHLSGVDYGDFDVVPGHIEHTYEKLHPELVEVFKAGVKPIFLGGDHSVSLPALRAASEVYGKVAMVHFDSHLDTTDNYFGHKFTHGTPFKRAAEEDCVLAEKSIQIGIRGPLYSQDDIKDSEGLGYEVLTRKEMRKIGIEASIKRIKDRIKGASAVYVTFDIDFLDPAYAPGTGTLEVGGFTTWEAMEIIRGSLDGANLIGFDIVEVLPAYDSPGQITAYAASNMAYEFITLLAKNKRDGISK